MSAPAPSINARESPDPTSGPQDNGVIIRRLLALSWQYRWGCIKVLGLQCTLLFMGLFGLGLTGLAVDHLRYHVEQGAPAPSWPLGSTPPEHWSPMFVLLLISMGVLAMALARGVINGLYTLAFADLLQAKIVVRLRADVFDKLQRLSFRFYDQNASGSIINRVTQDVQNVRLFVDGVVVQAVILTLSLCIYLGYMLSIHPLLTLACLSTTPLLWLTTVIFSRVVQPAYRKERVMFDDVVRTLNENLSGIHVVKGFAQEGLQVDRFGQVNAVLTRHKDWIFKRVATFPPFIGFLTQLNLVVLLLYGGILVIRGELPLGTGMIVFAGLLQQFSGQVANISNIANSVQQSLAGARRVFEVLDAPLTVQSPPQPVPIEQCRGRITFENVSFEYEPGRPVLNNISFTALPGQTIAILGTTGSGKSTLLSLIPRFYDPTSGRILLDGVDLRDHSLDELRRHIGLVFQESFLFSSTVAQNIAFGHPGASREQIERAARTAAAHDFIMNLPDGYDTLLREAATDLSGGQRQRLAIARAVLLEPAILLLDDPTAAIDPQTEHEILTAMDQASVGRTTLVVAHRLSTLRRADLTVVLEHGRVVQIGTHEQLMRERGPYRRAARMQIADPRSLELLNLPPAPDQPGDQADDEADQRREETP
ncbi:MAG: ABC transporter ATP-binding protein [Phycisphaeraceae bacterium]|nr:ABC transporter ATP-binding protein [Phycisphaeraceae bacterium]